MCSNLETICQSISCIVDHKSFKLLKHQILNYKFDTLVSQNKIIFFLLIQSNPKRRTTSSETLDIHSDCSVYLIAFLLKYIMNFRMCRFSDFDGHIPLRLLSRYLIILTSKFTFVKYLFKKIIHIIHRTPVHISQCNCCF